MWGEMHIESTFASWIIVIVSMVGCIIYGEAYNSITTVISYASITFFVLFEQRKQVNIVYNMFTANNMYRLCTCV